MISTIHWNCKINSHLFECKCNGWNKF